MKNNQKTFSVNSGNCSQLSHRTKSASNFVFLKLIVKFCIKKCFKGHFCPFRYRNTLFRYMLRCKFCIHLLVFILHFLKKNHFTLMYANAFKFLNSTIWTLWNYLKILKILPVTHFRGLGGYLDPENPFKKAAFDPKKNHTECGLWLVNLFHESCEG